LNIPILVSYSLYGDSPKYILGALKNAQQIESLGPEWKALFYLGESISYEVESQLLNFGAIVKRQESDWHLNGMFWRYKAIFDYNFDFLLFRDADSRISNIELCAIQDWIKSKRNFHIIRDHPHHNALILGGLWGTTAKIRDLGIDWDNARKFGSEFGQDQNFLAEKVYFQMGSSKFLTDSFYSCRSLFSFANKLNIQVPYMGESVDENENIDESLRKLGAEIRSKTFRHLLIYLKFHLKKVVAFLKYLIRNNRR